MSEERKRVLTMIAERKITVEEGERLLDAMRVGVCAVAEPGERGEGKAGKPKFLRMHVNEPGGDQVDVKVPLALIRAGMNLGRSFSGMIPGHAREKMNEKMKARGMQFDFENLDPKALDELVEALSELSVEVNDGSDHVQIFCE